MEKVIDMRIGFFKSKRIANKTSMSLNANVKGFTYSVKKVTGGYGLFKKDKM